MQTASLSKFVKGGGGLIGVKHNCRLDNFRVTEHALEKKDKASGVVIERYPTSTFVAFDITVEDPVDPEYQKATQYLRLGRVPVWRAQQLNEPVDPQRASYPGGVLPSPDGENPATVGPFAVLDGETGIWEGEEWPMFETELHNHAIGAGVEDQYLAGLDSKGVAFLTGIRVFLDTKAKPKSKKAMADPNAKEKTVIVATRVNAWPWAAGQATQATPATATPAPAAASAPAPALATVAATPPVPTPASDLDTAAVEWVQKAGKAKGGTIKRSEIMRDVFALTADPTAGLDGTRRTLIMQRLNNPNFVVEAAAAGHFLYDAGSDSVMVL